MGVMERDRGTGVKGHCLIRNFEEWISDSFN